MHKNRRTDQKITYFSFLCSTFFCKGLILLIGVSNAQAGGYDGSIPLNISPSLAAPNNQLPVLSILNWEKWGTSYWLNKNICRENNGNVICLPPQIARQLRWKLPSQKESLNS